jgi:hypothetical protein
MEHNLAPIDPIAIKPMLELSMNYLSSDLI